MKDITFFKLGGSWDLFQKNIKVIGNEGITNETLSEYENKFGLNSKKPKNRLKEYSFASYIYDQFKKFAMQEKNIHTRLSYITDIEKLTRGEFIALFNIESARFHNIILAPLITFLLQYAWKNPTKIIVGGQGCDTADVALLPFLDVFTFDTGLPPIIFTGSNRTSDDVNTDALSNLHDLIRVAQANLEAGAYWVFAGKLFQASDLINFSPLRSKVINDFSTFYSPHFTSRTIKSVISERNGHFLKKNVWNKNHISQKITYKNLLKAMEKVKIIDSTMQEDISLAITNINDPGYRALIVAGYSMGNVPEPIYNACKNAALSGKSVIIISRCLVGEVFEWGTANLLTLNRIELHNTGKRIISGFKLNRIAARALAIRAVLENLDQNQTQKLFENYVLTRSLSEYDNITMSGDENNI